MKAREAGVTAFCSKPLFMSELRDALTKSLQGIRSENGRSCWDRLVYGKWTYCLLKIMNWIRRLRSRFWGT